jgi:hypothetical protein
MKLVIPVCAFVLLSSCLIDSVSMAEESPRLTIEHCDGNGVAVRNPARVGPIEGTYGTYVNGGSCTVPGQEVLDGIIIWKISETVYFVSIVRPRRSFNCSGSGKEKDLVESVSGKFDLVDGFLVSRMRNELGYKIKFDTRNAAFTAEKICDDACNRILSRTGTKDIEFDDRYGLFSIDMALFKITTAALFPYSQILKDKDKSK